MSKQMVIQIVEQYLTVNNLLLAILIALLLYSVITRRLATPKYKTMYDIRGRKVRIVAHPWVGRYQVNLQHQI